LTNNTEWPEGHHDRGDERGTIAATKCSKDYFPVLLQFSPGE
jgi:hypothetical protein